MVTVYATNNPEMGYEFQGSYESLEQAQNAEAHRLAPVGEYAHWWADDETEEPPEWTKYAIYKD